MIRNPTSILVLLTGLNLLNYFDRFLIAALAPSIQKDLLLTDTQMGAIGSAFLWGYLLTSPIFGRLSERVPRTILITIGVFAWCVATAASGFARSYRELWWIRFAVGIGEASYAALAPTLLDDIAPSHRKNRILSVFFMAIPIGSALGFALGGTLNAWVGWRHTFLWAGGPAAMLALLCLRIDEPKSHRAQLWIPFTSMLNQLWTSRCYRWATLGFVAQTFALGGFAFWAPTYLHRTFQIPLAKANLIFGAIVVLTGLIGTTLGGFLSDYCSRKSPVDGALRICFWATILAVPFSFACLFARSSNEFFLAIAVAEFGIFMSTSPINTVFMGSVDSYLRAIAMAVSIFVGHLLGDMISVWLVGALSTQLNSLTLAMFLLPTAMILNGLFWWLALRASSRH